MTATAKQRRDPLAVGAVLLTAVAFAGSFVHVQRTVEQHGQSGWLSWAIAAMPELSVLLAVLRVRRDGARQAWPWIVGGTAAAFTLSANLAQAEASAWGWVVAGWPAWAALGAASLVELGDARDDPAPVRARPVPVVALTAHPSRTAAAWSSGTGARPVPPGPLTSVRDTARALQGVRAAAAGIRPSPSRTVVRIDDPTRPATRPDPSPDPSPVAGPVPDDPSRPVPPWASRSKLGPGPHRGATFTVLLADLRDATGGQPPTAAAVAAHYRIKAATARALRNALTDDRADETPGREQGEISA